MKNPSLTKCWVLLIMLLPCRVHAQDTTKHAVKRRYNSIIVSNSVIHFPGIEAINKNGNNYRNLNKQYGIRYERRLNERYSIGYSYESWGVFPFTGFQSGIDVQGQRDYQKIGGLKRRTSYYLGDITFSYRYNKFKKDKIMITAGPSLAMGCNVYVNSMHVVNGKTYYNCDYNWESQIGLLSRVSYDHLFLKGRVGMGVHIACRKYFGLESVQMDYGMHLGLNF